VHEPGQRSPTGSPEPRRGSGPPPTSPRRCHTARAGRSPPQQIGLSVALELLPSGVGPVGEVAALARADVDHRGFLAVAVYTSVSAALPLEYDHEPVARLLRARTEQARAAAGEWR